MGVVGQHYANDFSVTTTNPRTGTYSLEYPYTDANSELRFQISGHSTEVWLEWWLYTPLELLSLLGQPVETINFYDCGVVQVDIVQ
jgi:hypothetical protein